MFQKNSGWLLVFMVAAALCPVWAMRSVFVCGPVTYIVTMYDAEGNIVGSYEFESEECGYVWVDDGPGGSGGSGGGGGSDPCTNNKDAHQFAVPKKALLQLEDAAYVIASGDFDGDGYVTEDEQVTLTDYGLDASWFLETVSETHYKSIQFEQGPLAGGLLVRDLDGDGTMNHRRELLGNQFTLEGLPTVHAAGALMELDRPENGGNGDTLISSADYYWDTLYVWRDTDGDGTSSPSEMTRLSDAGLTTIDPMAETVPRANRHQPPFFRLMVTYANGMRIPAMMR